MSAQVTAAEKALLLKHGVDIEACREPIRNLLKKNSAPVFVGEKCLLVDRYRRLERALSARWPRCLIAYAFKCSYPVARSNILRELGAGAEVVSDHEYRMARELGFEGDEIVLNGPHKSNEEFERSLVDGALVNVNDGEELARLLELAAAETATWRIGIRVTSDQLGLAPSRFGFSLERREAQQAIRKIHASPQLELAGLHMHLHGDTDDPAVYRRACERLEHLVRESVTTPLQYVDMGGGFPAHGPKPQSRASWNPRPIEEYVETVTGELTRIFPGERKPLLILEPGRYLTNDAICLITRVIRTDRRDGRQQIVSNGAITMLPLVHYCPQVVGAFSPALKAVTGGESETIIYGSSCRENDILYEGPLPSVTVGDYLVHYATGAYNSNLSPNFIFEAPPVLFF